VSLIDAILATSVLIGVLLDRLWGWRWADSIAAYVIVFYALREGLAIRRDLKHGADR
jgi:divalent metal cation (Fe/Co/Zn/Cd) transporter